MREQHHLSLGSGACPVEERGLPNIVPQASARSEEMRTPTRSRAAEGNGVDPQFFGPKREETFWPKVWCNRAYCAGAPRP